jgi:hypothetical protein
LSDSTLRESINSLLSEVPGTGAVYNYERWAKDDAAFLAFFKVDGKIMGWEITRNAVPKIERIGSKFKVTHSYLLKGYYGLQDAKASEISFNAIVDAILLQFMSKKVTGACLHTLPKVNSIEPRMFGPVLCHCAMIALDVPEVVEAVSDDVITDLITVDLNYYLKPGDDISDAEDIVTLQGQ